MNTLSPALFVLGNHEASERTLAILASLGLPGFALDSTSLSLELSQHPNPCLVYAVREVSPAIAEIQRIHGIRSTSRILVILEDFNGKKQEQLLLAGASLVVPAPPRPELLHALLARMAPAPESFLEAPDTSYQEKVAYAMHTALRARGADLPTFLGILGEIYSDYRLNDAFAVLSHHGELYRQHGMTELQVEGLQALVRELALKPRSVVASRSIPDYLGVLWHQAGRPCVFGFVHDPKQLVWLAVDSTLELPFLKNHLRQIAEKFAFRLLS